jgi:two-component system OmpR family response regulator
MNTRVLVVDDEPAIAENLQAFLEDEGMQVKCARSAEQAIALVRGGRHYDVCIMDLRLPGIDGNMAILSLHEMRPALRFILHTGSANYVIPEELRMIGIDEAQLFRKPVSDMRPLADMVRAFAGG